MYVHDFRFGAAFSYVVRYTYNRNIKIEFRGNTIITSYKTVTYVRLLLKRNIYFTGYEINIIKIYN